MSLKITFGIITLNADFFLKQVLQSIYPFAHKIIIADGAVTWWAEHGFPTGSQDDTIEIIKNFPDPDHKILLVRGGPYTEKDEQCRAWFEHVPRDTDYVFCVDADEVHSAENMEKLIKFLEKEQPTSVGFKSDTFYGGFDRIIGGFERDHSFKRVLKYEQGCFYRTHRQPTLSVPTKLTDLDADKGFIIDGSHRYSVDECRDIAGKDITGNQLYQETGITMAHYSYVSAKGVYNKIRYYEGAVIAPGQCVPDYFNTIWLPWVKSYNWMGDGGMTKGWKAIEAENRGVHEFTISARNGQQTFTMPFEGVHPPAIRHSMDELVTKFHMEVKSFL